MIQKGQVCNPVGMTKDEARNFRRMRTFCQLAFKKYGFKILHKWLEGNDAFNKRYALDKIMDKGFPNVQISENYDMTREAISNEQLDLEMKAMEERLAGIISRAVAGSEGRSQENPGTVAGTSETPTASA